MCCHCSRGCPAPDWSPPRFHWWWRARVGTPGCSRPPILRKTDCPRRAGTEAQHVVGRAGCDNLCPGRDADGSCVVIVVDRARAREVQCASANGGISGVGIEPHKASDPVPAEKIATSPETQAAVTTSPSTLVLQKLSVPQIPVGVAPAPAVSAFASQYASAAFAGLIAKAMANAVARMVGMKRRRAARTRTRLYFDFIRSVVE